MQNGIYSPYTRNISKFMAKILAEIKAHSKHIDANLMLYLNRHSIICDYNMALTWHDVQHHSVRWISNWWLCEEWVSRMHGYMHLICQIKNRIKSLVKLKSCKLLALLCKHCQQNTTFITQFASILYIVLQCYLIFSSSCTDLLKIWAHILILEHYDIHHNGCRF